MPDFTIEETIYSITTNSILLDTCVLVEAFCPSTNEGWSDNAIYLIDESEYLLLVPDFVIIETWGMLVGKLGNRNAGLSLLTWLSNPSKVLRVREQRKELDFTERMVNTLERIDCVDAMLVEIARNITDSCSFRQAVPIATFDVSDFTAMSRKHNIQLRLIDARSVLDEPYDTL